jgi:hypothetical protein
MSDDNTENEKIETFEQFWDFYVGEHKSKANRILHFVGTSAAVGLVAGGLLTRKRWLLLMAPIAGYGGAWIGHFFIEKNKPASFKYPLWSFASDFKMLYKMATFSMQAEVDRVVRQEEEKKAAKAASTNGETASSTDRDERDVAVQNEAVN